ncbi:hypothetical protein [Nonomuraea rhizosphaerae]|uniref:hypothetical protein n=1 Tax=Nonomuraea rhizosphaerae TaxID=2665663 RepID=UPI001C5CCE82|nr:hypothetical protein [Nonomuraea rhizosphaerae]
MAVLLLWATWLLLRAVGLLLDLLGVPHLLGVLHLWGVPHLLGLLGGAVWLLQWQGVVR